MTIGRRYLGKVVELVWRDPNFRRCEAHEVVHGMAALATWREYGVVHDITDGVIQIVHSAARNVGHAAEDRAGSDAVYDELAYTSIHEALIERVTVFEPVKETVGT